MGSPTTSCPGAGPGVSQCYRTASADELSQRTSTGGGSKYLEVRFKEADNKDPAHAIPFADKGDSFQLRDATRCEQASLTPAIHSINLLKAEIDKEELLLQADETKLSDLTENAKAVESSRRMQAKQLHPLLKAVKPAEVEDDAGTIGLVDVGMASNAKLDFQPDEVLVSLIKQLDGHLKSLGENTAQVKVLGAALANTRAVVDDALYRRVGVQRYEKIVSG
ncbi:hypothetical protein GP486_005079 [Trichoglossum hirsutum]|uniref:Uncharacterized protein n=1 Tax=Trichoglossum hirsutum TaxID=265104 RepID=A0A9P8L9Y3_9PEZI|nr:hypothetical protein GP486_005079 [Trichoglossum hirsutum]